MTTLAPEQVRYTEFSISTRLSGRRRTVRVKVYEDVAKLREDAASYSARVSGGPADGYAEAAGVAHTYTSVKYEGDQEVLGPGAGLVRLWRGRLGSSVIVHEMTHVALGILRSDVAGPGALDEYGEDEEALCYLIGDLTRRCVDRLHFYGYYREPDETVDT